MILLFSVTGDPLDYKKRKSRRLSSKFKFRRGSRDSSRDSGAENRDSSAERLSSVDEDEEGEEAPRNRRGRKGRMTFGLGMLAGGSAAALGLQSSPPPSPPDDGDPPTALGKKSVSRRSLRISALPLTTAQAEAPPKRASFMGKRASFAEDKAGPPSSTRDSGNLTARILKDIKALGVKEESQKLGDILHTFISDFREKFKILITHYQIALTFAFTIDMRLPWPEVEAVNNLMRPLNFDFVDTFKLQCLRPMK